MWHHKVSYSTPLTPSIWSVLNLCPVGETTDLQWALTMGHNQTHKLHCCAALICETHKSHQSLCLMSVLVEQQHAQAILEMLHNNQVKPDLCQWTGDAAHRGARDKKVKKMSNLVLMRAFERILHLAPKTLPFTIRTAVKYRHSVYFGASIMCTHDVKKRLRV